jgi:hypothetical protein
MGRREKRRKVCGKSVDDTTIGRDDTSSVNSGLKLRHGTCFRFSAFFVRSAHT